MTMSARTVLCLLIAVSAPVLSTAEPITYPPSPVDVVVDTLHGQVIEDPYRWLEDQQSEATRRWIDEQNAFSRRILDSLPGRDSLRTRLEELLVVDSRRIPTEAGGRYFFRQRSADEQLYSLVVRNGLSGNDIVLIDPDTLSSDQSVNVSYSDISRDGGLIAYSLRQGGEDEVAVRFLNVLSRTILPDSLPWGRYGSVQFTADGKGVYYALAEKEGPRVYYHSLGATGDDELIFGDGYGPELYVDATVSDDGRYLLMTVYHGSASLKTDVYFKDLAAGGPVRTLVDDIEAQFYPYVIGEQCFMMSDWDAPNYRVLGVDLNKPASENWRELIPESEYPIQDIALVGGCLSVCYIENVVTHLKIFDTSGTYLHDVDFPAIGSAGNLDGRWSSTETFYSFSSFTYPSMSFRYDLADRTSQVWFKPDISVDNDRYEVKQVWYDSKDSVRVPMFLVYPRGLALNGSHPTLMYGYGGFNSSMKPYFSHFALVWVERGGVYAVTNLRGGGEFGEDWHRAGMLDKKQNTFDDLYAGARWLMDNGYTDPSHLAIMGGSNGGLLVGTALTQRPDLFQAVICTYPLLDMIRYHLFLVARYWVPEYGSAEDPDQFRYILDYSPYQNVKPGVEYPAVLFVTGDADTRVDPCHARKMTARLQAATASDRPILLSYDTRGGHSGGMPVHKLIDEYLDELSFLFWQLGSEP